MCRGASNSMVLGAGIPEINRTKVMSHPLWLGAAARCSVGAAPVCNTAFVQDPASTN